MELKSALKKLKESPKFKEWFKDNNKTYFSYAFTMIENNAQQEWQIGYYDKNKDKITTFIVGEKNIDIKPEEDIFKKSDMKVEEIVVSKVKLTLSNVLNKVEKFQKENYHNEKILKKIIILQSLENFGNIWNITYFTQNFNTLNMKITTDSGKIVEHNLSPLFGFDNSPSEK